jgi:hypothetical protein
VINIEKTLYNFERSSGDIGIIWIEVSRLQLQHNIKLG